MPIRPRPRPRRVLALFLSLPLAAFAASCQTIGSALKSADRPTARITSTSLSDLTLDAASLNFDVEVSNPYSVALPLASLKYDLASNARQFLSGSAPLTGSIPAKGVKTISLPANVRFADLLGVLSGVRPGQLVPYDAALTLGVNAPGLGPLELPIKKSGTLPVPAAPDVTLGGLTWDELSLNRAAATMRLDILNTNQFPLDLSAMDTTLALAGRSVGKTSIASPLALGAGESGSLEVPVSFSPLEFGMGMLNILRGNSADYRINGTVEGATPFGPISLPFDRSGQTSLIRE